MDRWISIDQGSPFPHSTAGKESRILIDYSKIQAFNVQRSILNTTTHPRPQSSLIRTSTLRSFQVALSLPTTRFTLLQNLSQPQNRCRQLTFLRYDLQNSPFLSCLLRRIKATTNVPTRSTPNLAFPSLICFSLHHSNCIKKQKI